jgi:hypothetical protein
MKSLLNYPGVESSSGLQASQFFWRLHIFRGERTCALPQKGQECNQPLQVDCQFRVAMRVVRNSMKNTIIVLASLVLLFAVVGRGQDKNADSKGKSDAASKAVRLTIVVTGGDDKQPVDNASVYVRYVEERKILKDKKIEMNLKTNLSGVCHAPEIPRGKFMIQVVAEGWKPYGEYFEGNQAEQTVNIKLVRPPKWY